MSFESGYLSPEDSVSFGCARRSYLINGWIFQFVPFRHIRRLLIIHLHEGIVLDLVKLCFRHHETNLTRDYDEMRQDSEPLRTFHHLWEQQNGQKQRAKYVSSDTRIMPLDCHPRIERNARILYRESIRSSLSVALFAKAFTES
jgi:hypothetical protein